MDINDGDSNEAGSIVTLMSEAGETLEDLRVPDDDEYKNLRDAIKADKQDLFVTVLESMSIRKVLPQFIAKVRSVYRSLFTADSVLRVIFFPLCVVYVS